MHVHKQGSNTYSYRLDVYANYASYRHIFRTKECNMRASPWVANLWAQWKWRLELAFEDQGQQLHNYHDLVPKGKTGLLWGDGCSILKLYVHVSWLVSPHVCIYVCIIGAKVVKMGRKNLVTWETFWTVRNTTRRVLEVWVQEGGGGWGIIITAEKRKGSSGK
jgi:hypothetical protein